MSTTIGLTKTESSVRTIEMSSQYVDILKNWLEARKAEDNAKKRDKNNVMLFPGKNGGMMTYDNFRAKLDYALKKADLSEEGIHAHRCRHTFTTMLLSEGIDAKVVSVMLGHSDVQTTLKFYRTVLQKDKKNASDVLAKSLGDVIQNEGIDPPNSPNLPGNVIKLADKLADKRKKQGISAGVNNKKPRG